MKVYTQHMSSRLNNSHTSVLPINVAATSPHVRGIEHACAGMPSHVLGRERERMQRRLGYEKTKLHLAPNPILLYIDSAKGLLPYRPLVLLLIAVLFFRPMKMLWIEFSDSSFPSDALTRNQCNNTLLFYLASYTPA